MRCACGLCRKVHFPPKRPPAPYPARRPHDRRRKRSQGKDSRLSVPVISLLPKPQTPLKSPVPHGCCGGGGGGGERVLGGARGCSSPLSRAEQCGARRGSGASPVGAGRGARSTWAVATRFWFPTAEASSLSSRSDWVQGPPRDALIGWGGCPGPVNLRRRGRGVEAPPERATPPRPVPARTRTRAYPASGGVNVAGSAREGRGAPLLQGVAARFQPLPPAPPLLLQAGRSRGCRPPALCVQGV